MQGPEGRPPNVSPARKGWEINPEEDQRRRRRGTKTESSALPVSLRATYTSHRCFAWPIQASFGLSGLSRLQPPFLSLGVQRHCGATQPVESSTRSGTVPMLLLADSAETVNSCQPGNLVDGAAA